VSDLPQGRTLVCLAGIERKPLAVFDAALVVGYTID
jgi:hypothetical protein